MGKFYFYLLLFLMFTRCLMAQQAKQFVFSRFNTGNGLASNYVNNLVQDHHGFIWLATINGLQRYDGHRFITYKHFANNATTPPTDNIAGLYKDAGNNLWVSTADNKVGIFNTETFVYKEIPIRSNTTSTIYTVKRFFETKSGKLFLFVRTHGLFLLDTVSKVFIPADNSIPAPAGWKYNDIREDTIMNRFWIASDSGLAVFNPVNEHLSYRGHNIDDDPVIRDFEKENFVLSIHVEDPRWFIMVTWNPVLANPTITFYDRKKKEKKPYNLSKELHLSYHEIIGALSQKNGRLWLYGLPFILEYKGGEEPFEIIKNEYRDEQSIKFDKVTCMYEDREKNIWICSDNGVFLFNPDAQVFYTYNLERPLEKEAAEGPVQTIVHLQNGQLWAGSWGKGLYCYDKNFKPIKPPRSLQFVKDGWFIWSIMQQRSSGLIWMGLQDGKVIVYDPTNESAKTFAPALFDGRTIRQIIEDRYGNLWFGSHGGRIVKWDRIAAKKNVQQGFQFYANTGRIQKLFADSAGFIWAATFGMGLLQINPATHQFVNFNKGGPQGQRLSDDAPNDIIQYNDSILLIANGAVDVLNTKTNNITTISTDDGLPSNDVQCLQKDQNGMVWLGMMSGLTRMSFEKKIFILYDRRDGIRYDIFNMAGAYRLPDSNLAFTTDHNFLVFNPDKMVQKDPPPDVKILEFKMANNSLLVDSLLKLNKIKLEYDKNSITISFGTLSYLRNNKKLFYYQLDKIDAGWVLAADERHQAVYSYLPPGSYTFKVKCVNGYGIASENITQLQIYVPPPFWKTWWFYSILLLLAVGVLYWIDKERVRRLLTLQQLRTQIAGNLHKDINTTLNNIHILSEIAKIKADKDIIKSKEYIDQINSKSRRMINDMDDMLWSIDPQNDSMLKTLERMSEFAEGIKNINNCKIELIVDEKVKSLKLDMKMRHEIFFIFKEALNNIFQLSNCTHSIINIDLVKSNLLIKIHDNGSGFDIKSLQNNNEIKEMDKRARLLNALLDIQSDKKGTAVILKVPI